MSDFKALRLAAIVLGCHSIPADPTQSASLQPVTNPPSSQFATRDAAPLTDAASPALATPAAAIAALQPLTAEGPSIQLAVSGFRDAVVSVPLGARTPRPILVALHGNFDRPEWQCETWRDITKGYSFVLCPRGIPRRDVPAQSDCWEYGSMDQTDRELEAGLLALRDRFGQYIAAGPVLFTGFSLGAILGVGILKRHPGKYGPIVFSEGGNEGWSMATVKKIVPQTDDAGTFLPLRLLYACGQTDCLSKSKATGKLIERAGGQVRVVSGGNVGHMYDGPVAQAIANEWQWLIQDDPRWRD